MCKFTQTVYSCNHERLVYHWMCDDLRIFGRRCVSHASDIEAKFVAFHVVRSDPCPSCHPFKWPSWMAQVRTNGKVIGCAGWREDSGSLTLEKCV